jgi:hypothetical protein
LLIPTGVAVVSMAGTLAVHEDTAIDIYATKDGVVLQTAEFQLLISGEVIDHLLEREAGLYLYNKSLDVPIMSYAGSFELERDVLLEMRSAMKVYNSLSPND